MGFLHKLLGRARRANPSDVPPLVAGVSKPRVVEIPSRRFAGPPDAQALRVAEAQVASEWKPGDIILDLYEVRKIRQGQDYAEGGMGRVYRVHHQSWNMDLAVKSPRPQFFQTEAQKENFTRECETWINLGLHPHIASCYYVRMLGGIPRVFAEYVEGGSLKEWIDSRKLYEGGQQEVLKRILDIAVQMAWGLHYAHEQGVIHQDVKPGNVLMLPDGTAKITDFGLAKARAAAGESLMVGAGCNILVSVGGMTLAYCSPEQASKQPLSLKTDLWSWAVSVLEMFVGEVCWHSGTAAQEVLHRLNEVRVEGMGLPEMPESLRELLLACLESDPAGRPKDAAEISRRLVVIYRSQVNEEYARLEPVAAELRADALNNRALSLLDLADEEQSLRVFEQALAVEPGHPECLYNRGLFLWRQGRLTDQALLAALTGAAGQTDKSERGNYLMGLVHLEQGDSESAVKALEAACAEGQPSLETKATLDHARELASVAISPRTFEGHTKGVRSVAFSADGLWALSGSGDNTLRLWELASGRCVRTFEGHTWAVESVALSADGLWALSGSNDKTLRLWELASGQCVRTFEGHTGGVTAVVLSADARWALSGSLDDTLRLWEVASGCCVRTFHGHTHQVRSVAMSADGRWALSGSNDQTLRLWEVASGRCVRTFEGHFAGVMVALSADGRWALSGSSDNQLRLWEVATGRCMRTFDGHTGGGGISGAVGRWSLGAVGRF